MIMSRFQGHRWHACESERLADGTRIFTLYVNGVCASHGGQKSGDPWLGRPIGRVWGTASGWVASPARLDGLSDSWSDEINRSERNFSTRMEACAWLHGFDRATRLLTRGMVPMTVGGIGDPMSSARPAGWDRPGTVYT